MIHDPRSHHDQRRATLQEPGTAAVAELLHQDSRAELLLHAHKYDFDIRFFDEVSRFVAVVRAEGDIAAFPKCRSGNKLFLQADAMLYKAKLAGRNRICPAPFGR